MAQFSDGLRDYMNASGSVRDALAGSVIRVYSGPIPASSNGALSSENVLLCEITDNDAGGIYFSDVSVRGVMTLQEGAYLIGDIMNNGRATFYRQVMSSDNGAASNTAVRIQGTIGTGGTDMELMNVELVQGGSQRLGSHTVVLPEGL